MAQIVTLAELKQAFWNNVICTNGTRRLVARAPKLEGNSDGPPTPIAIFCPQTPGDEFDLVLSLCEDGTQRVTVDWDRDPSQTPHGVLGSFLMTTGHRGVHIATPSTDNWHMWGSTPVEWSTVTEVLTLTGNVGYRDMNIRKGFCALRPPWKNKYDANWSDAIQYRFGHPPARDMFAGIDWTGTYGAQDTPPENQLPSLEDLFAEEGA